MDIHIWPPPIISAGTDLQLLATEAEEKVANGLDESRTAANAHPGWASSAALTACAEGWQNHTHDLVQQMAQLGAQLLASGKDYTQADKEAEQRMLKVMQLLSGS
jgi:hypothetical protein